MLFVFLMVTLSVIFNRKRRDDEILFLQHNQNQQNIRRINDRKMEDL